MKPLRFRTVVLMDIKWRLYRLTGCVRTPQPLARRIPPEKVMRWMAWDRPVLGRVGQATTPLFMWRP